jgi:hypothetical protein
MANVAYQSLQDALDVARDNMDARKELAARGPGHVVVAEVRPVGSGFELAAVTVEAKHAWSTTPMQRHIVMARRRTNMPGLWQVG